MRYVLTFLSGQIIAAAIVAAGAINVEYAGWVFVGLAVLVCAYFAENRL